MYQAKRLTCTTYFWFGLRCTYQLKRLTCTAYFWFGLRCTYQPQRLTRTTYFWFGLHRTSQSISHALQTVRFEVSYDSRQQSLQLWQDVRAYFSPHGTLAFKETKPKRNLLNCRVPRHARAVFCNFTKTNFKLWYLACEMSRRTSDWISTKETIAQTYICLPKCLWTVVWSNMKSLRMLTY